MPPYSALSTTITAGVTPGHADAHVKLNTMYNAMGNMVYYGTGFPVGVVSAPVGAVYIDKAITNGASSWIKKSGTGNTGWQVLDGDTGWRNITGLAEAGSITGGSLRIRRINNTVFIFGVNIYISGSPNPITLIGNFAGSLGDGFMAVNNIYLPLNINAAGTVTRYMRINPSSTTVGVQHYGEVGTRYWNADYGSDKAWPTTLPGTAA